MTRAESNERLLLAASLLLVAVFLVHGWRQCRELGFDEDEARNAVTGLYFADLLTDHPVSHPVEYTYRYYAQYPALGVIHWPPLFHFCEGILFLLAGRSVETARVTVGLFALFGFYFWFKLVRELSTARAAVFSTLGLALLPLILLHERTVMLEVPSLAVSLAAIYFWVRYLRSGRAAYVYTFAVLAALALLTKEHSIYLLPFCLLTFAGEGNWSLLRKWNWVAALALCAVLVVPYYVLALKVHGGSIEQHVVQSRAYTWNDVTFYFRWLPKLLGWPVLVLSLLGIASCWAWGKRSTARLMLLWILACYLIFTFLRAREYRYIFYWLPPFVYFASWPLLIRFPNRWSRLLGGLACVLVLANCGYEAWGNRPYPYPYLSGYSDAARWLGENTSGQQILLYDADNNGNFTFYMRIHDPSRRFFVVRKGLYVTRLVTFFGSKELVHSPEGIQKLLEEYGIRYIVVSDDPEAILFPVQQTLRGMLQGPQFKPVREFPVEFGYGSRRHYHHLRIYENLQAQRPSARYLRIPMLTLGRDIVLPLDAPAADH